MRWIRLIGVEYEEKRSSERGGVGGEAEFK